MNAFTLALLRKLEDYGSNYQGATGDDGARQGHGTCVYADSSFYDGEWLNGCRHGKGK